MKRWKLLTTILCLIPVLAMPAAMQAQHDPGARGGAPGAGGPFSGLNANEQTVFFNSMGPFMEVDSVSGGQAGEEGSGLGPTFNGNSCAQCHAEPTTGGSSPGLISPQHSIPNPQVALATLDNATNLIPSFITANGPVREARFVHNHDGSPDGGVHGLYTITGRLDAPTCNLAQPDFAQELSHNNVIFRIPTPTFGLGLVEATPDAVLQANLATNQLVKQRLGIDGTLNTTGNDGTVTRFGWKAQNKSLLIFAGEAYNVEQGVSNEAFPNERSAVDGCVFNGGSEDSSIDTTSDLTSFAMFMRLSAPPEPATASPSTQNGAALFNSIGCALCHSTSLTTGMSRFTGMSKVTYHPYSDFALHHMGARLADGISQGAAGPDEFRTAPLWGLGQRLFFLHDGRTSDLLQAIQAHSGGCRQDGHFEHNHFHMDCGSEANDVIKHFNTLSKTQVQDILNFLRSL